MLWEKSMKYKRCARTLQPSTDRKSSAPSVRHPAGEEWGSPLLRSTSLAVVIILLSAYLCATQVWRILHVHTATFAPHRSLGAIAVALFALLLCLTMLRDVSSKTDGIMIVLIVLDTLRRLVHLLFPPSAPASTLWHAIFGAITWFCIFVVAIVGYARSSTRPSRDMA